MPGGRGCTPGYWGCGGHSHGLQLTSGGRKSQLGDVKWWRCELLGGLSRAALDDDLVPSWGQHQATWPAFPESASPGNTRLQLCYADTCPVKLTAVMNDSPYFCNIISAHLTMYHWHHFWGLDCNQLLDEAVAGLWPCNEPQSVVLMVSRWGEGLLPSTSLP